VPLAVAFTKFDQVVTTNGRSSASTNAQTLVEPSCCPLLKETRDMPVEIVLGLILLFLLRNGRS